MAQEYRPGEIVPQSGIYTITHDAAHADMPHEVTVIGGFRPADIAKGSAFSSLMRRGMCRKSSISKSRMLRRCKRRARRRYGEIES
jgi:hypothetical protein